ncbi:MAG: hypothetical protein ACKOQM_05755 [Novosphingobium sp.]
MSKGVLSRLAGRHPLVWGGVFGLGLALTAWLERSGQIDWPWNAVMIAGFSFSLVLLRQASLNRAARCGIDTPALRAYNRRALIWALSYIVLLGLALTARNTWHPTGPILWLLALLPSLTIAYFVWAMGRYLAEEDDEYQRMRQINAALFATGFLLVIASVWGFLEVFGIAPHAEGFWAVGVWAAGLGLGNFIQVMRDRATGES